MKPHIGSIVKPHLHIVPGTGNWSCEGGGVGVWGYSVTQAYRIWLREIGRVDWAKWYARKHPVSGVRA